MPWVLFYVFAKMSEEYYVKRDRVKIIRPSETLLTYGLKFVSQKILYD